MSDVVAGGRGRDKMDVATGGERPNRKENVKHPGLNLGPEHGETHEVAEELLFGFWVFMMSDAILFGLLMATYASMLGSTAGGPGPSDLLDLGSAGIETAALLASSFTFGMASLAVKYKRGTGQVILWILMTMALGIVFLGLEVNDFLTMFDQGGVPSRSGYLSAFFSLVPLHGIHVTLGLVWMLALLAQIAIYGLDEDVKLTVLRLGLFWHFLDIVWVGIVSLVYLGGVV